MAGKVTDPELLALLEEEGPSEEEQTAAAAPSPQAGGVKGALGTLAKNALTTPVGLAEVAASLGSNAALYPLALAADAGEQLSPWPSGGSEARMPPPGHPRAPDYTEEEYQRQNELAEDRDDRARGDREARGVMSLGYQPKTEAGQKLASGLGSAVQNTLGRVGAPIGDLAAWVAKRFGAEAPEQAEAQHTGQEAANALVGAALPALGRGASTLAGKAAPVMGEKAIEMGRKALGGVGSPLAARKPIPEAAVQEALSSGAILPFSTIKGIVKRLGINAEELGTKYGDILARLEDAGVHGPYAQALARRIADEASATSQNSLGSPVPGFLSRRAEELEGKALPISGKGRLGLMQSEEMKRGLQREARNEYNKLTQQQSPLGSAKEQLASVVREEIERAVDDQAALAPDVAAEFRPVKSRLANTLGALAPAKESAARAARRKAVGLTDTIAGSAVGAATGNPVTGALAALGHGLVDRRLPSTGAWSAYKAQQLLEALQPNSSPLVNPNLSRVLADLAPFIPGAATELGAPGSTRFPLGVPAVAADEDEDR